MNTQGIEGKELPDISEQGFPPIEVRTSWCIDDVRCRLSDAVEHMTDEEIHSELERLAKWFHEQCVSSGWDIIDFAFEIKDKEVSS